MAIRDGKKTDVKQWSTVPLHSVCTMKSGNTITSAEIHSFLPYPCYGGNGLRGYVKDYTHCGEYAVIGRQGALCGSVKFVSGHFFASEHALVVSVKRDISARWLYYVLGSMNLNQYSESSAQPGLSALKLLKLSIVLPKTKLEQESIATALSDVDALISSLDAVINKKKDIKQAAMQELLTGKTRLEGFSGEWVEKKLGDSGFFLKGAGIKRDEALSGTLPCVRYGEIYTVHSDIIKSFCSFISEEIALTAKKIHYGDILFACSGETKKDIGKSVAFLYEFEAYAGGDIIILRDTEESPHFLAYALNSNKINKQKSSKGQGDAVVHIGANAIASIKILLPPTIAEQDAIATVLSDMDAEITALQKRRDKVCLLKTSMMQELLTGNTRLNYKD